MAIQLEFINIIVPVWTINEKYPSGWVGYLNDYGIKLGRVAWHDDHLVRTAGVMDPDMADGLIAQWSRMGFQATEWVGGKEVWKDFCVVDSFGVSIHDCDWLTFDSASRSASLTGTEAGRVVGRNDFPRGGRTP